MTNHKGNRPVEIFGYHFSDNSLEAKQVRKKHWCPFKDRLCSKKSRLIDYPFGNLTSENSTRFA